MAPFPPPYRPTLKSENDGPPNSPSDNPGNKYSSPVTPVSFAPPNAPSGTLGFPPPSLAFFVLSAPCPPPLRSSSVSFSPLSYRISLAIIFSSWLRLQQPRINRSTHRRWHPMPNRVGIPLHRHPFRPTCSIITYLLQKVLQKPWLLHYTRRSRPAITKHSTQPPRLRRWHPLIQPLPLHAWVLHNFFHARNHLLRLQIFSH